MSSMLHTVAPVHSKRPCSGQFPAQGSVPIETNIVHVHMLTLAWTGNGRYISEDIVLSCVSVKGTSVLLRAIVPIILRIDTLGANS